MLSFFAVVISYLLGGLTLLPILLACFIAFIFYTSPTVAPFTRKASLPVVAPTSEDEAVPVSLYRAGWLTVRRTYEPLNGPNDGTYVGMVMNGYKAFMDNRSRDPRRSKPKDQFFGVLKQNVLFLYDNEEQVECWAAVEVTQHRVLIYPENGVDGELFVKRNAICLRPTVAGESGEIEGEGDLVKELEAHVASEEKTHDLEPGTNSPWFIFAKVNSDKEDWYHSLVQASKISTTTKGSVSAHLAKDRSVFDPDDMARLVEGIDQQPDSIPVRWLNAILGRIFLAVYRTETLEAYIISRIVKKLKRVKTPSILSEVQVREVNVGSSVPFFSKPMLKDLTTEGDASMEVHVSYVGDFRITIETVATINLGSHFKPYSVRLVLAVILKEIEGTLLIKIKKPPSNRVWFGFSSMPRMVLSVEPVVSTRQIKWSMITSPIESRIREVIMESIVVPHMDDFPFFNSSGFFHRGGIFGDALRKENDLSTTTGGSGDEEHAIGHDDALEDEVVGEAGNSAGVSTGREEGAVPRQRKRRNSFDRERYAAPSISASTGGTLTPTASIKSSISSFSLSSWKDAKLKEVAEKRKSSSWFAGTTPPAANPSSFGRSNTVDEKTPTSMAEGEEASASKLRDVLNKSAKSREKEREKEQALAYNLSLNNLGQPSPKSQSVLSLTAPTTTPLEASIVQPSLAASQSEPSLVLPATPTPEKRSAVARSIPIGESDIAMRSVPNLVVQAASPTETTGSSPIPFPTRLSDSPSSLKESPPSLPSRPSFTKPVLPNTPPPPPRRTPTHADPTSTSTSSALSFASAASTSSLISAWKTKAADKEAIAAGVAQAKNTMKRWGANWNARRGIDDGEDDHSGIASSPPQDFGRSAPGSRSSSREGSSDAGGRDSESYKDYRAGKSRGGEYYAPTLPDGTSPVDIVSQDKTPTSSISGRRSKDSSRRLSLSTSPSGLFTPTPSQPTTKLSTPPVFTSGSPPTSTSSTVSKHARDGSVSGRTYTPATMMKIPGIREESHRKAVAGDHVSAGDVTVSPAATLIAPTPPTRIPVPVVVPPPVPSRPAPTESVVPTPEPPIETAVVPIAPSATIDIISPPAAVAEYEARPVPAVPILKPSHLPSRLQEASVEVKPIPAHEQGESEDGWGFEEGVKE